MGVKKLVYLKDTNGSRCKQDIPKKSNLEVVGVGWAVFGTITLKLCSFVLSITVFSIQLSFVPFQNIFLFSFSHFPFKLLKYLHKQYLVFHIQYYKIRSAVLNIPDVPFKTVSFLITETEQ